MSRFQSVLCIVFVVASMADARFDSSAFNSTVKFFDEKITVKINEAVILYNETSYASDRIFGKIVEKVQDFKLVKPKEIAANLEKRRSEFNQLIANINNSAVFDCFNFMNRLEGRAAVAIDKINECVDEQFKVIADNITRVHHFINKGLEELNGYRKRSAECVIQNLNSTETSVLRCLVAVKREIYLKRRAEITATIPSLWKQEARVPVNLFSCASKSLNLFYGNSSSLIESVNKCIASKNDVTTTSPSTGPN